MSDVDEPLPAIAVSPADQSSDREQSDADNARAVDERETARKQAVVDRGITSDLIKNLIRTNQEQTAKSEQLAAAAYADAMSRIEMQERAKLARRRFRITIVVLVLGVAALLFLINRSLNSGTAVRKTLLDCVQPTGKCYLQGQRSTAKLVGDLNQVTVLAAACAPDYVKLPLPARIVAIERCIRRGLKGGAPSLAPSPSPARTTPRVAPSATPGPTPPPSTRTRTVAVSRTATSMVTTTVHPRPRPPRTVTVSPSCLIVCLPTLLPKPG